MRYLAIVGESEERFGLRPNHPNPQFSEILTLLDDGEWWIDCNDAEC